MFLFLIAHTCIIAENARLPIRFFAQNSFIHPHAAVCSKFQLASLALEDELGHDDGDDGGEDGVGGGEVAVGAVAEVAAAGAADDAALLAALVLGLQLAGVAVAGRFWKGNGRRSN